MLFIFLAMMVRIVGYTLGSLDVLITSWDWDGTGQHNVGKGRAPMQACPIERKKRFCYDGVLGKEG